MERVSNITKTLASTIPELVKLNDEALELQKQAGQEGFQDKEREYVQRSAVKESEARKKYSRNIFRRCWI